MKRQPPSGYVLLPVGTKLRMGDMQSHPKVLDGAWHPVQVNRIQGTAWLFSRRQQVGAESQAAKLVASAHASALRKGLTGVALIAEVDTLLSLMFLNDMGNIHAAEAMAMWYRECEEWAKRAPR